MIGRTRCDECGWVGRLALVDPCPSCGTAGGKMTERAAERFTRNAMTPLERANARGVPMRTLSPDDLGGILIRVIPKRSSRTAKATEASRSRGDQTLLEVVRLHNSGLSASQIDVRMGRSAAGRGRTTRKWLAKARAMGLI